MAVSKVYHKKMVSSTTILHRENTKNMVSVDLNIQVVQAAPHLVQVPCLISIHAPGNHGKSHPARRARMHRPPPSPAVRNRSPSPRRRRRFAAFQCHYCRPRFPAPYGHYFTSGAAGALHCRRGPFFQGIWAGLLCCNRIKGSVFQGMGYRRTRLDGSGTVVPFFRKFPAFP